MSFGNDRRKMGVRRSVRMSVSKIPANPKDYPDEYEPRFRVGGARPASAEDTGLAELARKLAPVRPLPEAQALSEYDQWGGALSTGDAAFGDHLRAWQAERAGSPRS